MTMSPYPQHIIQSLDNHGYWSAGHRDFKGLLFASMYSSKEMADAAAAAIANETGHTTNVVTIYRKYSEHP